MNKIEFLRDQIIETRNFTIRLIGELPEDMWYRIPDSTDSNFAWQVGHLIVSQNFHTLTVISGRNAKVAEHMPLDRYNRLFYGMGSLHRSLSNDLIPVKKLKEDLELVHNTAIENLMKLSEEQLDEKLEPIPFKHPRAEIKYEALSWSFKHEMWHCAEMEDIKIRLGYPMQWMK
ncbi:MAG: DinB family protein [Bacteroidia bacterium]|nr:DinB family protein [Bacteroidia bacterium]